MALASLDTPLMKFSADLLLQVVFSKFEKAKRKVWLLGRIRYALHNR